MKRVILLLALIFGLISPIVSAQGNATKKKVAVYMTGSDVDESIKKVIGSKLVSAITATNGFAAVERTSDFLLALSKEQDYQASGEVRDNQIAKLGQRFGVKYVIVADVTELFDEYYIDSRLINVESGLVEKQADESGTIESTSQLISLSQKLANKLLESIGGNNLSSFSTTPVHKSLYTMKAGTKYFITPDQWDRMTDKEKNGYERKGLCWINDGENIIISIDWAEVENSFGDTSSVFDQLRRNYYSYIPDERLLNIAWINQDEINSLLTFFGMRRMEGKHVFLKDGNWCKAFGHTGSDTFIARKIYTIR